MTLCCLSLKCCFNSLETQLTLRNDVDEMLDVTRNLHQHLTPELQAKHADLIAQIEISVLSNFMMLAAHSHEWARLQKFSDDMSKAGHYARNIRHTADKHTAVLDDMKSLEVEMDRHWTYLEGRLAGLNMAGN